MIMESKTTSKTSSLKALLLRAWRERWSDLQWGINIKTVLPRGVSGDVYNLADCILQQALVGAGINQLILSYLRHSLSAQLVSYSAVLQRLSKFREFNKVHCTRSLLEFLRKILPAVTCHGKSEETALATAILSVFNWLMETAIPQENQKLSESAHCLLRNILEDEFYQTLLCLARYSDPDLFADTGTKCLTFGENFAALASLDVNSLQLTTRVGDDLDDWPGTLIQCCLVVRLVQNPSVSTHSLCTQLRLLARVKQYQKSRLYAEIIRGSLLALHDVSQTVHESQWGAFAFIKVPHLLAILKDTAAPISSNVEETSLPGTTTFTAIELLLQHTPLLDAMDVNNACSTLECLLGELHKIQLISDGEMKTLLERRINTAGALMKSGDNAPSTAGIPKVIICAEPTLAGILKTLSTDYHKIQEPLLGMLHQVLTGKSFELILAVATVQGQLRTLVTRLIRFNECSKVGTVDKSRGAQLFDITFLMLTAIVQNYGGVDRVLPRKRTTRTRKKRNSTTTSDETDFCTSTTSLFEHWVCHWMVDRKQPKSAEQLLNEFSNTVTIDVLLQQFNVGTSGGSSSDSTASVVLTWKEILFNMGGVMHAVLIAWEQGALIAADVKRILDAVRGRMCCVPLAAAAWLCAYMRTAPQEQLLKPMNMVQQLLAPASSSASSNNSLTEEDSSLRERWQLTSDIIRRMQRDILSTTVHHHHLPAGGSSQANQLLSIKQPALEQLLTVWRRANQRGWLDHNSAEHLQCLVETAGARWLVSSLIQLLLAVRFVEPLRRARDFCVAIFHVDIVQCTYELIAHCIPQIAFNHLAAAASLQEPYIDCLARLTSDSLHLALEYLSVDIVQDNNTDSDNSDEEIDDLQADSSPPTKHRKLSLSAKAADENWSRKDQLVSALKQLFLLCESVLIGGQQLAATTPKKINGKSSGDGCGGAVTPQTYFAYYLLENLVRVGAVKHVKSSSIAEPIPNSFITNLLRTLPEHFSYKLLVHLHDVRTIGGRANLAKDLCSLRNYRLRQAEILNSLK